MYALCIREPGDVDVLAWVEVPDLVPDRHQVRVRVAYAGLNRADVLQRRGMYPPPPDAPADVPGLEYAGVVDACGPGVTRFRVGDRVYGLVPGGAHAEALVAHEREVARVPEGVSLEDAAAVPEAFVTAFDALVARAALVPGERVLVTAVGSGVGTAAVQIARALGSSVAGTSRTADKIERAARLGLERGVVAGDPSALGDALEAACPEGFDVIVELVGGAYVEADLRVLRPRGRIVVVGLTGGLVANINLGALLRKRASIVGTVLRSRPLEEKIAAAQSLETSIGAWLVRGTVRPIVDRVFPVTDAAEAHRVMERNESFGKLLLHIK
ncbi:MAG: NAD(P)H-quinone oxidoreductase [Polyangiaceae bacterium]